MKKCSTVSFEGQVIFIGIDVHKESWVVNLRHCHRELDKFSMNPSPEMLAKYLRKNYPGAEYRSVYEAGFCGFWAHRRLCELGIQNIVINPADVPTSGKERDARTTRWTAVSWRVNWRTGHWRGSMFRLKIIWN